MRSERRGAAIAGISGAVLLVAMFMSWYGIAGPSGEFTQDVNEISEGLGGPSEDISENAWEAFSAIDVLLALAGALSLITALAVLSRASVSFPIAGSSVGLGLGALAFVAIAYRAIDPPGDGDADREIGLWLGLVASAGIAYGSWVGMQEDPQPAPSRDPG